MSVTRETRVEVKGWYSERELWREEQERILIIY